MNHENRIKTLNALLAVSKSPELLWERAALFESLGTELLKDCYVTAALEKFRASVADKRKALLAEESVATRPKDVEATNFRRLALARNYLGIAMLEKWSQRFDRARTAAEAARRTLKNAEFFTASAQGERANILHVVLTFLAELP